MTQAKFYRRQLLSHHKHACNSRYYTANIGRNLLNAASITKQTLLSTERNDPISREATRESSLHKATFLRI